MQNFSKAATDNDSFRTDWPSGHDPNLTVALLQTSQSAKSHWFDTVGKPAFIVLVIVISVHNCLDGGKSLCGYTNDGLRSGSIDGSNRLHINTIPHHRFTRGKFAIKKSCR
jgi:hypothetical protein